MKKILVIKTSVSARVSWKAMSVIYIYIRKVSSKQEGSKTTFKPSILTHIAVL